MSKLLDAFLKKVKEINELAAEDIRAINEKAAKDVQEVVRKVKEGEVGENIPEADFEDPN